MSEIYANLALGFATAFEWQNLLFCFLGVTLGTLVGVLPGIGALATVSMLLPLTFYMDMIPAIMMLAGVYYGAEYGGSTASILLHLPGSTSNAVTCLDGYPMAQQGRAGVALLITALASFVGGILGIVALTVSAPVLAEIALSFQSAEYFAITLFGLLAAATVAQGRPIRALAMVFLGLLLGCIGININSGVSRFTFGQLQLYDGLSLVALAMGLFGLTEVITSLRNTEVQRARLKVTLRSMLPTAKDLRDSTAPTLRGTAVGIGVGALPGTGAAIATFISYALEKKVAKDPSRFGKGAIEGIASPEASNNAAAQTAFIPTLALGIPGSATMAIMLGALMLQGIQPGPALMVNHPEMVWGLIASFFIGNVLLLVLNIPMVGIWVRILQIPYSYLFPVIIVLVCIGVYSVRGSEFDVMTLVVFAAFGYMFRLFKFPVAPLLLAFILAPIMEENFRRAMLLAHGDPMVIVQRPIAGTLLALAALLLAMIVFSSVRERIGLMSQRRLAK